MDAPAQAYAEPVPDAPAWARSLLANVAKISERVEQLESVRPILPDGTYHPPAGAPSAPSGIPAPAPSAAAGHNGSETSIDVGDGGDYVPDVGVNNPHARAVYAGGDTYLRPQRFNLHRDTTFDALRSKPKGTLFEVYTTLEPSLRYLYNVADYTSNLIAIEGAIDPEEMPIHLERIRNSVAGVYGLINKYVGLIHLRATFGDNPSEREKAKLEHVRDSLAQAENTPLHPQTRLQ